MGRVAVLMTCYNRKEKTIQCLRNLFRQDLPSSVTIDVFLVNDGCTDGTAEAVSEEFPQIHIVQGDGTLFWNRGMCLAWEESRKFDIYDGVLWLNDDTMLFENALKELFILSCRYPNAIIVASIASTDRKNVTYGGFVNNKLIEPDGSLQLCDKFNGNCVFVPSTVSDKIGYLDPYYRHAKGDSDYSMRAYHAGVKNIISPIVGTCDRNPINPIWNKGSIVTRFKKLYSPLGNNPKEIFHLYRKFSIVKACWFYLYIHIRVLFTFLVPQRLFSYYIKRTDKRYK